MIGCSEATSDQNSNAMTNDPSSGESSSLKLPELDSDRPSTGINCDILSQRGCNVGEKCTYITTGFDTDNVLQGSIGCIEDGVSLPGETCLTPDIDDFVDNDNPKAGTCQGQYICYVNICMDTCLTNVGNNTPTDMSCDTSSYCASFSYLTDWSIGLCLPRCDPLSQNCPEGLACYLSSGPVCTRTVISDDSDGKQNASCQFTNGCAAGYFCAASTATTGQCRKICDRSQCVNLAETGCGGCSTSEICQEVPGDGNASYGYCEQL